MVRYYNEEIADNSKVELVLMAGETDPALAKWASATKMPWPVLSQKDHMAISPLKKLRPRAWPTYYLVDFEGKVLAKSVGSSAPVKAKLKELLASEKAS
ncbi:MAG: hypothetical protein ACI8XO_003441 [Verrucomicrobiales bacterium]